MVPAEPQLRVLQVCHDYQGPFSAVCHQYVRACESQHVTTLFICGDANPDIAKAVGGDEVIFFEQPSRAMRGIKLATLYRLARLFVERRFDVVIAHRYKPIYFAGIMSYFFSIPVLLGVAHEHEVFRRKTRSLFINFWRRNILCVGVSKSVSDNIEACCGPLPHRLFTLPHALDPELADRLESRQDARHHLGLDADAFCIGTVGRLVDKKDHAVLIEAFARSVRANDDFRAMLVIVGGGPLDGRLRDQATALGISDRVVFTGHVDDAFRIYRALDVFVLPSGEMEAFGIVLLEAMLACIPVVSSDAPGPREVVGADGIFFPAGDADALSVRFAELYAASDSERASIAAAGRARFDEHYTLASFGRNFWQIEPLARLRGRQG